MSLEMVDYFFLLKAKLAHLSDLYAELLKVEVFWISSQLTPNFRMTSTVIFIKAQWSM